MKLWEAEKEEKRGEKAGKNQLEFRKKENKKKGIKRNKKSLQKIKK